MTVTRHCTMMVVSLTAIVVVNLLVLAKYAPRAGMPWMILAAGDLAVVTAGVYGSRRRPGSMTALRPLWDPRLFDLALPLLLVPLLFSCPAAVHLLEGGDRPGPGPAETGR